VQHFEIIGLDKLLDSSLEPMHEEHVGDAVAMAEQEEMHHENANVCFSLS
jgi:ubiquitin-conjugating enzyme E2 O